MPVLSPNKRIGSISIFYIFDGIMNSEPFEKAELNDKRLETGLLLIMKELAK